MHWILNFSSLFQNKYAHFLHRVSIIVVLLACKLFSTRVHAHSYRFSSITIHQFQLIKRISNRSCICDDHSIKGIMCVSVHSFLSILSLYLLFLFFFFGLFVCFVNWIYKCIRSMHTWWLNRFGDDFTGKGQTNQTKPNEKETKQTNKQTNFCTNIQFHSNYSLHFFFWIENEIWKKAITDTIWLKLCELLRKVHICIMSLVHYYR